MRKILILCTGNSCRSIIAEALINRYLNRFAIEAKSAGVNPSGKVNPNAKKVLEKNGCWRDEYYSKNLDEVVNEEFNLVITVCDNAKETCPTFPKSIKKIHIGFEDPDGKEYAEFEKTFELIKSNLLSVVQKELLGDEIVCWCKKVYKKAIEDVVKNGAKSLKEIKQRTNACTGSNCKITNPIGICCSNDIQKIIKKFSSIFNFTRNYSCSC